MAGRVRTWAWIYVYGLLLLCCVRSVESWRAGATAVALRRGSRNRRSTSSAITLISMMCPSSSQQPSALSPVSDSLDKSSSSTLIPKQRYAARIMYDGTRYRGWQDQDDDSIRTVQATISKIVSKRLGTSLRVTGASRTDIGVHARGQAIHFDTDKSIDFQHFEYSMNRLLPQDIKIYNVSFCPLGDAEQVTINELWHATKSATGKLYSYRFCTNGFVDPIRRVSCAHVFFPISIQALEACLALFVGTHDFNAFTNRASHTTKEFEDRDMVFSTIKTIYSINLVDEGSGYYRIDVHLKGALYKMIRNIVGTSFDVASGRYSEEWVKFLLSTGSKRDDNKSRAAPPEGLCLEKVYYDHY